MKKLIFAAIAATVIALHATAQTSTSNEPKTKLEAFETKSGVVIIHGFTTIGSIRQRGVSVDVDCREFTDVSARKKEYGITLTFTDGTVDPTRQKMVYIDYDEIDLLTKGIGYIETIDKAITKLDGFQVDYHTKGGLTVSIYGRGDFVTAMIDVGFIRISLDNFTEFKDLISKAKSKLDSIRQ